MSDFAIPDTSADARQVQPISLADPTTASNSGDNQEKGGEVGVGEGSSVGVTGSMVGSGDPTKKKRRPSALTARAVKAGVARSHHASLLWLLRGWLGAKGVDPLPQRVSDLFPSGWKVGNTVVPIDKGILVTGGLEKVLPQLRAYDEDGDEIFAVDPDDGFEAIVRLTADWEPSVEIVAGILSAVSGKQVKKEGVLTVAQKSPQALEKLKDAGKAMKQHFNRFLDLVSLRRSPEFLEVSARYKAQLRTLIEDQQEKIRQARIATRRVNQLLGERDDALSRLDPGYAPKRATAAAALAEYGIDLDEQQTVLAGDETVNALDLEELNF